jgi:hypothetical protein
MLAATQSMAALLHFRAREIIKVIRKRIEEHCGWYRRERL